MHHRARRRRTVAFLSVLALLVGSAISAPVTSIAGTAGTGPRTTLSVYTCCGSLAGFGEGSSDPASMHATYAALWTRLFPQLQWKETTFASQPAMEQRLAAAVASGTPPDLVFIQGGAIGDLVLRRLVMPLDNLYANSHIAGSYFLPGMSRWAHFGGHWWAIPAVSGPLGGQEIYLPKYVTPLGYGNSTLRSFGDYYRMSLKAVRFDAGGNLTRIGFWPGVDSWETTGTLMCSPGHGLYNAANQPTATDPCNVAYLQYLQSLAGIYGGYAKLSGFLAHDPDFLAGDPHSYLTTGKAVIVPSGGAYWNLGALDLNSFGVSGGIAYQLTPYPPTPDGTTTNVASYPSTMQEIVIPRGAQHAALAFAVSKATFWDAGHLLGRSLSGSPVASNQQQWLGEVDAGEAAVRRLAGLPGNPIAGLQGVALQPKLGLLSRASNPINPVDAYYQRQIVAETKRVLEGLELPKAALQLVQVRVLAEQQRLQQQYGAWNW